jgi:hypothetical protein
MVEPKTLAGLKSNVEYYLEMKRKYAILMHQADDEYNHALDEYIEKYDEVNNANHA